MCHWRVLVLGLGFCLFPWIPVQGDTGAGAIEPPDVFVKVGVLRGELELLLKKVGRQAPESIGITFQSARPREVYSQALALYGKADQFAFEQVSERRPAPKLEVEIAQPKHVYVLIDASLGRVRAAKSRLGIRAVVKAAKRDASMTPTDVFNSLRRANQNLNVLLKRSLTSRDVYSEITYAFGYTTRLLARFSKSQRVTTPPALETVAGAGESYRVLLTCFDRVQSIAKASGEEVLSIDRSLFKASAVLSSDVYDLAALIVSELRHLQKKARKTRAPFDRFDSGAKTPSQVKQRARHLLQQLVELESWVKVTPNWLERKS